MTQPNKRTVRFLLAFFFIGAAGFLAGAVYSWQDEHGGVAGTAHVTKCDHRRSGKHSSVSCTATWIYNDRRATGYVENAKANQEGKDISVRIHGTSHVTNVTYWVPIGLGLFALFEAGVGVMILRQYRKQTQAT